MSLPTSQTTAAAGNALDAYLDRIQNLPPTPTVLIKLIDLFRRPEAEVDEVVQLLRRDPALALEVLRRCKNSLVGNDADIHEVDEAVYRLGFFEVYEITVALLGTRMLSASKMAAGFPLEELRRHSSLAAIAAGALAQEVGESEGMAFTTALLHDVGKLVFALAEEARYASIFYECKRTGGSLSQLEKTVFGFDHSEIGAHLLRRWGMPEEIVAAVLEHIDPAGHTTPAKLTVMTYAASALAGHIQSQAKTRFADLPAAKFVMEFLQLQPGQVNGWEHLVRSRVARLAVLETPPA